MKRLFGFLLIAVFAFAFAFAPPTVVTSANDRGHTIMAVAAPANIDIALVADNHTYIFNTKTGPQEMLIDSGNSAGSVHRAAITPLSVNIDMRWAAGTNASVLNANGRIANKYDMETASDGGLTNRANYSAKNERAWKSSLPLRA